MVHTITQSFKEVQETLDKSEKLCQKHLAICDYCDQTVEIHPVVSVRYGWYVIFEALVLHYTKNGRCVGSFSDMYSMVDKQEYSNGK